MTYSAPNRDNARDVKQQPYEIDLGTGYSIIWGLGLQIRTVFQKHVIAKRYEVASDVNELSPIGDASPEGF